MDTRLSERAFDALYLELYPSLCDYTSSFVQSADVAEDIVQSVFVAVWESRHSWTPRSGARAYLFGACRNRAVDHLRHAHVVSRSIGIDDRPGLGEGSHQARADEMLEALEAGDRLRRAVAYLPRRRRQVVELRLTQHTNREIATALGISVKGVENQFSRAVLDLRHRMNAPRSRLAAVGGS